MPTIHSSDVKLGLCDREVSSIQPGHFEPLLAEEFDEAFLAGQVCGADGDEGAAFGEDRGGAFGHAVVALGDDQVVEIGITGWVVRAVGERLP